MLLRGSSCRVVGLWRSCEVKIEGAIEHRAERECTKRDALDHDDLCTARHRPFMNAMAFQRMSRAHPLPTATKDLLVYCCRNSAVSATFPHEFVTHLAQCRPLFPPQTWGRCPFLRSATRHSELGRRMQERTLNWVCYYITERRSLGNRIRTCTTKPLRDYCTTHRNSAEHIPWPCNTGTSVPWSSRSRRS